MLGRASAMLLSSMRSKPADVPRSLLDNSPLTSLPNRTLKVCKIQKNIDKGFLDALSITASPYSTGESVSFYQGVKGLKDWVGPTRIGRRSQISHSHLLASSALPALSPAVKIGSQLYGDGAVHQLAPPQLRFI